MVIRGSSGSWGLFPVRLLLNRRDMRRTALGATMALVFLGGASIPAGCSFAFVEAPPANTAAMPYFECTSGRMAPNVDAVLAGVFALAAVGAASDPSAATTDPLAAGAIAAGMLASAIHGWNTTARCRDAKAEQQTRMQWRPGSASPSTDAWVGTGGDLLPLAPLPGAAPPPPAFPPAAGAPFPSLPSSSPLPSSAAPPPPPASGTRP